MLKMFNHDVLLSVGCSPLTPSNCFLEKRARFKEYLILKRETLNNQVQKTSFPRTQLSEKLLLVMNSFRVNSFKLRFRQGISVAFESINPQNTVCLRLEIDTLGNYTHIYMNFFLEYRTCLYVPNSKSVSSSIRIRLERFLTEDAISNCLLQVE